jgi:hypothetical protein
MSHREGHATGGAAAPTHPAAPRSWADTFPALPTHQQQELLDLAARQGYLLADQIPPVAPPPADEVRTVLQQALTDRVPPAPLAEPVAVRDASLDPAQQDVVARALATPDLFLLVGPTGTGKTRIAVEIVRQVAAKGGKALLLSPDPMALDELLPKLDDLAVVRRLGPGESADRLPPTVAGLTPGRREATVRETLVRRAAESLAAAEQRAQEADRIRTAWTEWSAARERHTALTAERTTLAAKRAAVADDVRREADAPGDAPPYFVQRLRGVTGAHAKRVAAFDTAAAELATARTAAAERRRTAEAAVHALKPKATALQAGRWYSLAFWKAKGDGTLAQRLAEAEARLAAADAELTELTVREQKLAADRRLADAEHAVERARFLDTEAGRRHVELDAKLAEMDRDLATAAARTAELFAKLRTAGTDPANGAVIEAEVEAARRELEFARGWTAQIEANTDRLVREACGTVQVVVGPIAGIGTDATVTGPFDLLVIDDAHRLAEADFTAAARLARRWVLLGEPADLPTGRQRVAKPDLFARLAAALRHDVWTQDGPRLVCRLYPIREAERRRLECEPVVDAPDIELRLFTPPGGDPTLAEVAFPAATAPAAAREYLVRELGEVTCEPRARSAAWEESPTGPVLRFGPADPAATFAAIGPGIREELAGLETRAVHFDTDWTTDRAKEWAAEHVGTRAGGRLATLTRPYRACPGLARWLNQAFAAGFAIVPTGDEVAHVEFLAVPDHEPRRRHHGPSRPPGRVGGAGYEIDLADPRQRAALPPDLADLPTNGFVNLPEAQALVRYLEALAGPGVAVTSPFPAQVAVLRRLVARSPRLAKVPVLDAADAARHECDLMAVSLTRSHVARAVPFGDGPGVLAGLLGRARKKILFAGDPGTLARRLQWEGPVDHLDATEAARERAWVAALADCPRVSPHRPRHAPADGARI